MFCVSQKLMLHAVCSFMFQMTYYRTVLDLELKIVQDERIRTAHTSTDIVNTFYYFSYVTTSLNFMWSVVDLLLLNYVDHR